MSPAPRTVSAREDVRASHSWTTIHPRRAHGLQASHSWTYREPRPAERADAKAAA